MIEHGLRTLLLEQHTIVSRVPAKVVSGITYPGVFVERAVQKFPGDYVVVTKISRDPMKHLGGTTGMQMTDVDVDCYSRSQPNAGSLAKAVSDFLKDYTGPAGGLDKIDAVLWEDERDFVEEPQDGSDAPMFVTTLSFTVQHSPVS